MEAEAYANVKDVTVRNLLWEIIICHFSIPQTIVTDNGAQFESQMVQIVIRRVLHKALLFDAEISRKQWPSKHHQQSMLNCLKKGLDKAKGCWVEELPGMLWAYQTMKRQGIDESLFALAFRTEA